jgi:hypothetical protein
MKPAAWLDWAQMTKTMPLLQTRHRTRIQKNTSHTKNELLTRLPSKDGNSAFRF